MKLSIIIPSVNDPYLQNTLDDIKQHAKSDYEIIVVNGREIGMRSAINKGITQSKGEYIMKTDEHCMFGEEFDIKLLSKIEDNWIVVPRRYNLDVKKWAIFDEPPVDYDRLVIDKPEKIGGVRWRQRAKERKNVLIDETMIFQGSFYLMSRKHWDRLSGLQTEGYGEFTQEAVELALKTWLGGGKVMVNKTTWYAHKHRKFKRVISPYGVNEGNKYSQDYWLNNRWENRIHDLDWLMRRFGL